MRRWRSSGFLEDKAGRQYSLNILTGLSTKRALVPILWFYEVDNGLLMVYRRKRITLDQVDGFLTRLKALPIDADEQDPADVLQLPAVAQKHNLTNYDAAYSALAMRVRLPLATTDEALRRAASTAGVEIVPG